MTRDVQVWQQGTLGENLERVGVSRRDFLSFCGKLAAAFTVGSVVGTDEAFAAPTAEEVAQRLEAVTKPNVVWLQLQECTGCSESAIRSAGTTVEEIYQASAAASDLKRLPTEDEVASAILFMASDLSSGITGQALDVNCGEYKA